MIQGRTYRKPKELKEDVQNDARKERTRSKHACYSMCRCTSVMSSSPYRCCGVAEDALFKQSLSCNHMLDALFTMHNCTYMQTQTNHKCRLLKRAICIFHNAHKTHAYAHNDKQITSTCAQTCYMHYAEHTQSQTNHTLACKCNHRYKCTYSMCVIHTYLHYTNTAHALQSYMYFLRV